MFKILVLQSMYNLSDDQIEYSIHDRLSFMRFLGIRIGENVPDAQTIRLFKDKLEEAKMTDKLFALFNQMLAEKKIITRKGRFVEASIIEVPHQINTPEKK